MDIEECSQPIGLQLPKLCQCTFISKNSAYFGELELHNQTHTHLYFNIVSSFGPRMDFLHKPQSIPPKQTIKVSFKIRPPNQISRTEEFIGISYSRFPLNCLCSIEASCREVVKLQFDTEIIEDETIDMILKEESEALEVEARYMLNEENFAKASQFYEESFLLYRKNYSPLLGLTKIFIHNNNLKSAFEYLELYSYFSSKKFTLFLLLKCRVMKQYLFGQNSTDMIRIQLQRELKRNLKLLLLSEEIEEKQKEEFQQISLKIDEELEKMDSAKRTQNVLQLRTKAIDHFDQNDKLKQFFPNKKAFDQYLADIFDSEDPEMIETPEYALDPINYEIFREPMITPSGMSYEKEFLTEFFKMHGNKDPFSRELLNPLSVVPNTTLKFLVRNNPDLHKWIKYENESSHF